MSAFLVDGLHVEQVAAAGKRSARPALLLVHGAGHGAWCWANWMDALSRHGWDCYALSLRNHPGSRAVPEEQVLRGLRVDDYADDVEAVARHLVRKLGAASLVVAGHSLGGIVVQRFAARQGAVGEQALPVAGLILVTSVPPAPFGPLRDTALPVDRPYFPDAETARTRYFHAAPKSVTDAAIRQLVPESPAVMNEYSLGRGVPINPTHIRCPVLVLSAEFDGSSVPRDRRIADFYGGDFLFCRGIGHDLMLDSGWESPLASVAAWLARHWPA